METKSETRGHNLGSSVLHEKDLEKIHQAIEHSVRGDLAQVRSCLESLSRGGLKLLELTATDIGKQSARIFERQAKPFRQRRRAIRQGLAPLFDEGRRK